MFLFIIVALYIAFFITAPIITIFHELGHAFAYLILTKPDRIDIYIGSYDQRKKVLKFKIGKLFFYIKYTFPFTRGGGLCSSSKSEKDYRKYIIILLAGPLFTVLIIVFISFFIYNTDIHGSIKLYCALLILFSIIGLYTNLKPRTLKRNADTDLENDGKQIVFAMKLKDDFSNYIEAIECFTKNEFELAVIKLKSILERFPDEENILKTLALSSIYAKHYSEAEAYLLAISQRFEFSITDTLNLACMQSFNNKHEESILNYRIVLKNNSDNVTALNNLGYALSEKGEYSEAQQLLEKAMQLYPETGHLYGTMGYLKILKGDLEDGKSFVDKSIELDSEDAYAYKALGVYYLRSDNPIMAKDSFKKAKELYPQIDLSRHADQVLLNIE